MDYINARVYIIKGFMEHIFFLTDQVTTGRLAIEVASSDIAMDDEKTMTFIQSFTEGVQEKISQMDQLDEDLQTQGHDLTSFIDNYTSANPNNIPGKSPYSGMHFF